MMNGGVPTTCLAVALLVQGACRVGDAAIESGWTDPAAHTSGFVTANGARLHYLDWGGSGPALILIHGYGDNPHIFDDLAPAFTDRFRVLAYARRGHGLSEAREPYDTPTLVQDLRELMDSLGITRAHLVGWSMGGNEITAMAGTHPDRVDRIVYFDAAYDWADSGFVAAVGDFPLELTPPARALGSLDAYRAWYAGQWFPALPDPARVEAYIRSLVDVRPDGTVRPVMSDSTAEAIFARLVTDRRDYAAVRAPALAIYSETFLDVAVGDSSQVARHLAWERERFIPFRRASIERVRRELPGVEILQVPGTHADFPFIARDQVVRAMREFLTTHEGG